MFVVYKLPTVVISRRTDQYSKAYESLVGREPQQGLPKTRAPATAPAKTTSDSPPAPQVKLPCPGKGESIKLHSCSQR